MVRKNGELTPSAPIECFGIHSFSSTASETVLSSGQWIPGTNCPVHKPQIDFSHATRVQFIRGATLQEFSNKVLLLGTGLSNVPSNDLNTINGTIFTSDGMNFCGCLGAAPCPSTTSHESDLVLFSNTIIGANSVYFRYVTPYRWSTTPSCCPWNPPFADAVSNITYISPGTLNQGGYTTTPDPPVVQEDLVGKFLNLNDPHSEMPLLQNPCLITPAFVPLACLPPARIKNIKSSEQIGNLTVNPAISSNRITIESNQSFVNCQILNSLGGIVINNISINNSKEIDISNLKAGLYIVKSSNGSSAKFVKY